MLEKKRKSKIEKWEKEERIDSWRRAVRVGQRVWVHHMHRMELACATKAKLLAYVSIRIRIIIIILKQLKTDARWAYCSCWIKILLVAVRSSSRGRCCQDQAKCCREQRICLKHVLLAIAGLPISGKICLRALPTPSLLNYRPKKWFNAKQYTVEARRGGGEEERRGVCPTKCRTIPQTGKRQVRSGRNVRDG